MKWLWNLVTHESELTKYPGCGRPKVYRTRRGTRGRPTPVSTPTLNSHSYSLNANLWRAPPLASNHLCSSPRCLAQFITLVGRWLQEGVFVGERELQWPARRCGRISRCGRPYDLHHLWLSICDLVPEAVRRRLWVGLLQEGGVAGSLGAAGPRPSCIHTRACSFV
jgi:hypothetical protein